MNVTILKDITRPQYRAPFWQRTSRIDYDAKSPRARKYHALVSQIGPRFGSVGDRCDYLTHEELLALEREGFVRISRRGR